MGEHDEQFVFEMGYNKGFKDGIKGSIPKADYENRLKTDLVAMLTELQTEIEEKSFYYIRIFGKPLDEKRVYSVELDDVNDIIQQKINALKEIKDGEDR